MKSPPDSNPEDLRFSDGPDPLTALLLYEDAATGLRAKQLVDQLVEHVNLIVSFRLSLCRFDLLGVPSFSVLGDDTSLDADLVVLSAHGHDDLPHGVRLWLDRWFAIRSDQARAVVMSLDYRARDSALASRIHCFLQAAGCRVGVEVFSHFGQTDYSELDSAIAGIRYRAETTSALLDETLNRAGSHSFRYWGINE